MHGCHHHEECGCGWHGGPGPHECGCGWHGGPGPHECGCGWHGEPGPHECGCGHGPWAEKWGEGRGWEGHHCHHPEHHHHEHGPFGGYQGGSCWQGQEENFGFRRRFRSRAEVVDKLEAYLKELEAEAQAVREKLEKLRSTGSAPQQG